MTDQEARGDIARIIREECEDFHSRVVQDDHVELSRPSDVYVNVLNLLTAIARRLESD